MRTLKISLLVSILSITISAQWDPKRNYTETGLANYYFIDSLIAENTVGGKFKYLFDYNTDGKINNWIRYWVTNGNLMEYQKLEYFYDNSNKEIRTILFLWHNNSWDSSHQTLSEYNQSNQLVHTLDQVYDDSLWQNSLKTIYNYDLSGNEKTVFKSVWYNNQWRNSRFITNYYSSENLKDSTIILWYINAWENYYRITYNYNDTTNFLEQCNSIMVWNLLRKSIKFIYFIRPVW